MGAGGSEGNSLTGLSGQGLAQLWGARDQPSWGVAEAGAVDSMEQPIFLSDPLLLYSLTVQTNQLMDTDRQAERQTALSPPQPSLLCQLTLCYSVCGQSAEMEKKKRKTDLSFHLGK